MLSTWTCIRLLLFVMLVVVQVLVQLPSLMLLTPYLPGHEITGLVHLEETGKEIKSCFFYCYGNNVPLLAISYAYMKMLGEKGLPYASLSWLYWMLTTWNLDYLNTILFLFLKDDTTHCAHEFIIDLREFEKKGIKAIDVSKRLQDYGFHSQLSFPVPI